MVELEMLEIDERLLAVKRQRLEAEEQAAELTAGAKTNSTVTLTLTLTPTLTHIVSLTLTLTLTLTWTAAGRSAPHW